MTRSGSPDRRFPAFVYREGEEPDPRFTLANERTFLAWIRTSLALMAGGVALEALHIGMQAGLRLAASTILVVLGLLVAVQAWRGWAHSERAMRVNRPLPDSRLALPISVGVAVVGALVLLGTFLG